MSLEQISPTEIAASLCLLLGVLHTFSVSFFQRLAGRFEEGSAGENLFHLLGEVEVVFGIWAAIFMAFVSMSNSYDSAVRYLESRNFTEPVFVFVIMAVCSTRPILNLTSRLIQGLARLLPFPPPLAFFVSCMIAGPLLGSFITEPAAMTVTALILLERFYSQKISMSLRYATLGLLFVNISIGGTLTPYAAPPVLMVATVWNWDLPFMLQHFGWKAVVAIVISTSIIAFRFRKELSGIQFDAIKDERRIPTWVTLLHLVFLAAVVISSHHIPVFCGVFLFFLGLVTVTKEHQDGIRLNESLLVGFFLAGLVVLGGPQRWWLEPILMQLNSAALYFGAMGLTAFTDNAALTYLGAQVPDLNEAARYALVAGSVVGGGLTVIANAPNPAGFGILNPAFGEDGILAFKLLLAALMPTAVAAACFWLF